eukprot:6317503-Prorocentrum_lima.AAC.1
MTLGTRSSMKALPHCPSDAHLCGRPSSSFLRCYPIWSWLEPAERPNIGSGNPGRGTRHNRHT